MTTRLLAAPGRPHRDDVLIAAAGLAGGLVMWALGLHTSGPPDTDPGALPLLPLAVMCGAELLRRTGQPWALLPACAAFVADQAAGSLLPTVLMFTDVVYAAVVYGPPRTSRRVLPASVVFTVGATLWVLAVLRSPQALLIGVVAGLVTVAPAWTGLVVREHREEAEAERLRAGQTALLAELDRREAVTAERARMARELHDLVANHLSAIAIHSTAAQALADPEATRDALAVIRGNSVQGLAEMRRLIGLLRDAPEGGADRDGAWAVPTLDGLDALLARARGHGFEGGLRFTLADARPPGDRLSAPVELAAYRLVQESVTNAFKHASPGEVTVELGRGGPDGRGGPLTVCVTSPYGARPGPGAPGSGMGLTGMRERVALLGGVFEAGPVADPPAGRGGPAPAVWRVRAVLPVEEAAGAEGAP